MKTLEKCAEQAVKVCASLRKGEKVTIIYDKSALKIATAIGAQIDTFGAFSSAYCMESYGQRPNDGTNPLKLPKEIKESLAKADLSFFVSGVSKKGEFESFRHPMLDAIKSNTTLRHIHMPGITENAFIGGMSIDYNHLKDFTSKINEIAKNAKQIRVTTPAGSNFTAEFGKYNWCVADGFSEPGKWVNLPDGETFTTPLTLSGRIVVDGVLGDYFDQKYGLLAETPLVIGTEYGRITRVQCPKNRMLERDFIEYLNTDTNSNRFGEFAIGTNLGIEKLIGNMIHDEKFQGVHIAIGDPIGEETGADWKSDVHCDMVMRKCNIFVEDVQIMTEGKFDSKYL